MAKMDFNKFLTLLNLLGPAVLLNVKGGEKIAPLVAVITSAIGEAQQIKGATGAEKKAHVLAIAAAAVTVANTSGKVQLDPEEVQTVASDGIDAVVGVLHVVQGAKVVKQAA